MNFTIGDDRILFVRINGIFMPIGCLTDNSMEESSDFLDTTTRDNAGWATSRPLNQKYSISFSGIQVNSTVTGGSFNVASYDKLKELKRGRTLLDWKIQGITFPIVDYGMCYISSISEANTVGELITFTGSLTGFGRPKMADLSYVLSKNNDPMLIINESDKVLMPDFYKKDFKLNDFR